MKDDFICKNVNSVPVLQVSKGFSQNLLNIDKQNTIKIWNTGILFVVYDKILEI